jgi:Lrp/AsnC family transcriptional regulator, regulator for asnA, asnC and gidA
VLHALQLDGRTTFTKLAHITGLSVPAIRQRYQRLVDDKIVRVLAFPSPSHLGLSSVASVEVVVSGDSRRVAEALTKLPQATYVVEVAGASDVGLELVCKGDDELQQCLGRIRTAPAVHDARLVRYHRVIKQMHGNTQTVE